LKAPRKQSKWQQVAVEAAKQCGQNWLPHFYVRRETFRIIFCTGDGSRSATNRIAPGPVRST
jgi:hypothetical protein